MSLSIFIYRVHCQENACIVPGVSSYPYLLSTSKPQPRGIVMHVTKDAHNIAQYSILSDLAKYGIFLERLFC